MTPSKQESVPYRCPLDGKPLKITGDYPDTRTSVDFHEVRCAGGHTYELSVENQDGSFSLKATGGR